MKVGSLVVIKPYQHLRDVKAERILNYKILWCPVGDEKTIYTIRSINSQGSVALEEGIIGYNPNGGEIYMRKDYVKEIQPPISSEEIAELVEESCSVAVN